MSWQVSAKKAVKAIEEQRKPFTEKAHAFIKAFTQVENALGKELYDPIQRLRDTSARIHAEESADAKAKEQAELTAKQKKIDDIAQLEGQLRNGYSAHLTNVKQAMLSVYSNCTLENIAEAEEVLNDFIGGELSEEAWVSISLIGDSELIKEVRTEARFNACNTHFTTEVTNYANYLISLLPQRREELEAGVKESKAAEELARKQKEEAEAAQLASEKLAEEEAAKAKQQAAVTVHINQANREVDAPRAIESYDIIVTSVDGWRAIVDYYILNSRAKVDDLGKIKLDQMKAFVEKQAKVTGEVIDHEGLTYEPKYKAVARATKKKAA
ncbi:hypothetical protein [Sphingobacterium kyonggiense]